MSVDSLIDSASSTPIPGLASTWWAPAATARCIVYSALTAVSVQLPPMKTSVPGVYAVNSAHILKGNLNVNETIEIAEEAVRGVLAPAIAESQMTRGAFDLQPIATNHDETDRELVARS